MYGSNEFGSLGRDILWSTAPFLDISVEFHWGPCKICRIDNTLDLFKILRKARLSDSTFIAGTHEPLSS